MLYPLYVAETQSMALHLHKESCIWTRASAYLLIPALTRSTKHKFNLHPKWEVRTPNAYITAFSLRQYTWPHALNFQLSGPNILSNPSDCMPTWWLVFHSYSTNLCVLLGEIAPPKYTDLQRKLAAVTRVADSVWGILSLQERSSQKVLTQHWNWVGHLSALEMCSQ